MDIDIAYAKTIMTEEERKHYDNFISVLSDMVLKYGKQVLNENTSSEVPQKIKVS